MIETVNKCTGRPFKATKRHRHTPLIQKKAYDQESIQLPNTFRFKTPKGKKDKMMSSKQNGEKQLQEQSLRTDQLTIDKDGL